MKVGTDGVLLGAWGDVTGSRILDIGTGTGLIALMAAQRNHHARVFGIDIDKAAILQAQENIAESPFCGRVKCQLQDVLTFRPEERFDAILCNPPFFTEDTLPDDASRILARNSKSMPFDQLIPKVASMLGGDGAFSVIIPYEHAAEFIGLCLASDLHLQRRCLVHTTPRKPPRRTMLTFSPNGGRAYSGNGCCAQSIRNESDELCLMNPDGTRSQAYQELTRDFYL